MRELTEDEKRLMEKYGKCTICGDTLPMDKPHNIAFGGVVGELEIYTYCDACYTASTGVDAE